MGLAAIDPPAMDAAAIDLPAMDFPGGDGPAIGLVAEPFAPGGFPAGSFPPVGAAASGPGAAGLRLPDAQPTGPGGATAGAASGLPAAQGLPSSRPPAAAAGEIRAPGASPAIGAPERACSGPSPWIQSAPNPPPPCRHWVISDVHGCGDSLLELVARLPVRDRLVLCGDVINRGPRIEATMELAWHLVQSGRAVWLMGNHEQRLAQLMRRGDPQSQVALAGCDTFRQLGERSCRRWLERLEQLPLAYWGEDWVATHAGFDPLTWQPHLSVRMAFWQNYDGRFGRVIVGHTPAHEVRRIGSIVLIDTGACYGGPLTAYCPETGASVQVGGLHRSDDPLPPVSLGSTALPR